MKKYRNWLFKLLLTTSIIVLPPLVGVMGFNYYIDPLWNFNHENNSNDFQIGLDERQQKTNYISNRPFNYKSILLGTSRVTYMNQSKFENDDVYNYSLSEMRIDEYLPYLEYAKKQKRDSFDKVYMELYFESFRIGSNAYKEPHEIIRNASNPLYRYTTLFSYNTLKLSIENKRISDANYYDSYRSYNRHNIAKTAYVNEEIESTWKAFQDNYDNWRTKDNYPYDEAYIEKLQTLKEENPDSEFVVFTDPMPASKLAITLTDPLYWDAYVRWFEEMTSVFGKVYSFHHINGYTSDTQYWFDNHHYYPNVGDKMIAHLDNREMDSAFCTVVTKGNLQQYLTSLQEELKAFQQQ